MMTKAKRAVRRGVKYWHNVWTANGDRSLAAERKAQAFLFFFGTMTLLVGLSYGAEAESGVTLNTVKIDQALLKLMTYIEGSFGALIMAAAGIGAIMSAAFGQYRAALSLMVVAIGAFILRSFMETFFNTEGLHEVE